MTNPDQTTWPLPASKIGTNLTQPLIHALETLEPQATVLDIGSLGWKLIKFRADLRHSACDLEVAAECPEQIDFRQVDVDSEKLPWPDDYFSMVVASHIIEHLSNPLFTLGEIVRVCKPGGHIYLECPSDRSTRPSPTARGFPCFLNFWDDPTHTRPWPPRALYRALIGYNINPINVGYYKNRFKALLLPLAYFRLWYRQDTDFITDVYWEAFGFVAYALGQKPLTLSGFQRFQYRSLKGITESDISHHFELLEK